MNCFIKSIFACSIVFFGAACAVKDISTIRFLALDKFKKAQDISPQHPNVERAAELLEFANESHLKGNDNDAYRAYGDALAYADIVLEEVESQDQDTQDLKLSQPVKIQEATEEKTDATIKKPEETAVATNVVLPSPAPNKVESLPTKNDVPWIVPQTQEKEARSLHLPPPRKIEDLKKEGLSDSTISETPTRGALFKEKLPGVVAYAFGEPQFQSSSLKLIESVALKLKNDSKASAMFQAQIAQGEDFGLADSRFEHLKAALTSMGIKPDRVSLDDKKVVSDWPEIRIFILK